MLEGEEQHSISYSLSVLLEQIISGHSSLFFGHDDFCRKARYDTLQKGVDSLSDIVIQPSNIVDWGEFVMNESSSSSRHWLYSGRWLRDPSIINQLMASGDNYEELDGFLAFNFFYLLLRLFSHPDSSLAINLNDSMYFIHTNDEFLSFSSPDIHNGFIEAHLMLIVTSLIQATKLTNPLIDPYSISSKLYLQFPNQPATSSIPTIKPSLLHPPSQSEAEEERQTPGLRSFYRMFREERERYGNYDSEFVDEGGSVSSFLERRNSSVDDMIQKWLETIEMEDLLQVFSIHLKIGTDNQDWKHVEAVIFVFQCAIERYLETAEYEGEDQEVEEE